MSIDNFIPELWEAAMLERWVNMTVFPALMIRDYEGTATKGNTVHITGVVQPEIKDYKQAGRTTSADAISDTGIDLLIDQEKNFDFYVDDIDRVQAAGSFAPYTDAAGNGLVQDADEFLAQMLVDHGTALPGSAPTTGDQAFDLVRDARKALTKNKAPNDSRVLVVNAEFEGLLLGANSKLTNFNTSGDNEGLRQGTIGGLLGFRVVTSNNLPDSDSPQFVAFHQRSAAYVSQIDTVEGMRANDRFADRIRGLHVYGGKVLKPEGVLVYNPAGS
jgi:hypothetical protein